MTLPIKPNSLQTYQTILYGKALHPEFFPLRSRRVIRGEKYELELWVMSGSHVLRFEHGPVCCSELVTDQESNLPDTGVVSAFLCAGEREFDHRFGRVNYMTSVQTETLSENLYVATMDELVEFGNDSADALVHHWEDESGPCVSILEVQQYVKEAHVQAYHMMAQGGLVLRTQTLFEHVEPMRAG